ncbi:MAG: hypothetical protein ABIR24_08930 [Verrucomicrobiota bacterium]
MNNDSSKLRHTQKQASASEQQQQQQQKAEAKEFSSVEELLRHDAAEIVVPPGVAVKLNQSIANSPKPKVWWQRFFSRE